MTRYIPHRDALFDAWLSRFAAAFNTHAAALGFTAADVTAVMNAETGWQGDYTNHIAARNAAHGARATKDNRREEVEKLVRQYVRQIQSNPNTTDAIRAEMGITIPRSGSTLPSAPEVCPRIEVNWNERGRVRVYAGGTPGLAGWKFPEPAKFVEVQYRFENGDWLLAGVTTRRTFNHILNNTEPVIVQYRARYLNGRGGQGPWSETDVAMVAPVELQLASSQAA